MTAPRWTIDPLDGDPKFTDAEGHTMWLCVTDIDEARGAMSHIHPYDAHAALVAAVRDADTLTQARQLAAPFVLDEGENGSPVLIYEHADGEACVVGEITCAPVIETLTALLALLAGDRP